MKENFGIESFSFETVSREEVLNLIKEFPRSKAIVSNNSLVAVLNEQLWSLMEN